MSALLTPTPSWRCCCRRRVRRLNPGQDVLDLGDLPVVPARMDEVADWTSGRASRRALEPPAQRRSPRGWASPRGGRRRWRVVATSALLLWEVLVEPMPAGFDALADEAFRAMVLARIIEPTSKADSVRVLDEIGAPCPSVRTLYRALGRCQDQDYRDTLAKACPAHSPQPAA